MECAYSESLEPIANGNGWGCGADAGGFLTCSTLASTCCKGVPEAQSGTHATVATKSNSIKGDLRCTILPPSYQTSGVACVANSLARGVHTLVMVGNCPDLI